MRVRLLLPGCQDGSLARAANELEGNLTLHFCKKLFLTYSDVMINP